MILRDEALALGQEIQTAIDAVNAILDGIAGFKSAAEADETAAGNARNNAE